MAGDYSDETIKRLFSKNICAFPSCTVEMVNRDEIVIGRICHIEGKKPKSARYNPMMSDSQRKGFDNLILMCPNHHTEIDGDAITYTTEKLLQMKKDHSNKLPGKDYVLPDNLLRVLKVSVNTDEYSIQRVHNLLKIFKTLKGNGTVNLWHNYFTYVLKALKFSSPLSEGEKEMVRISYDEISELREQNEPLFQELLLFLLNKLPSELAEEYIRDIKSYIEEIIEKDFENINIPEFYVFLRRPQIDTIDYLIRHANDFSTDKFDRFLTNADINFGKLKKDIFMELECRLWTQLAETDSKTDVQSAANKNIKTLVNKLIRVTF